MTDPASTNVERLPTTLADALVELAEARDTLRAIGAGEVDAFVVSDGSDGPNVFGLSTVDTPYRLFVENMHDGAATVSDDGLVLWANTRLGGLLRCPREAIVGAALATFIADDAPIDWRRPTRADHFGSSIELELLDGEGVRVPVLVGTSPLQVDGDHLACLTFTDLTSQKAQEAEIRRLNQAQVADGRRFTAVVEALQEGVLVQDDEGRVLEANQTASRILGIPLDELVTDPPTLLHWADETSMPSGQTPGRRALRHGRPQLGVLVRVDRGDEPIWLEINSVPLRLPGETEVPVVISSFRDVTARVAAEEAIRFQALLLDTAGQAIIAVDARGMVVYWNQHAGQMYGWSADEAIGRSVADLLLSPQTVAIGQEKLADMLDGETWGSDHWVRRRDGVLFPIFATSTPVFDEQGSLVAMITVATDITDRKRAEDQARQLTAIVESSSDAIVGMTLERVITSWNSGATALFGYQAAEALGQNLSMLVAPSERGQILARLGGAQGISLTDIEIRCLTKLGAHVDISLSISPILDDNGQPVGLSGIGRDITDRVELEQIAIESREELTAARHAAELEGLAREEANRANQAKSEFLSRMSHELRTPLNAVLGFGQILLMDDLTTKQRENVGFIRTAGEHLLGLINDVLDISRIEAGALTLSLESVPLHDVVANALSLMGPQAATSNISMPSEIGDFEGVYVRSDRQRLLQVLLNLLSNAVKYNRPGGRIGLGCEAAGDTVSIAVSDTGVGIGDADLNRLFTPFERLGAENTKIEGTGVGLALSRVLSQQMGGSLTVTSTVGSGSTFTLGLPASPPPPAPADPEPVTKPVATKVGSTDLTVLSIEDHVANIRLMEHAMQRCGNVRLLTAIQGRLGLELASEHLPDLILLDLQLPDLSGEVVLEHLLADPATASIPVVICSADASPGQRRDCLRAGAAAYLTKPFDLADLFALVERARAGEPLSPAGSEA